MVRRSSFPLVTFQTIILLFSLLFLMYLSNFSTNYSFSPGFGPSYPSNFSAILSQETPVFRYNASYEDVWIEIRYLQTNNTPVALSIFNENETRLNVTSITSISEVSMIASRENSGAFWLQVERLQSGASIYITLKFWRVIPPPTFSVLSIWPSLVICIPAFLYSLLSLLKLAILRPNKKAYWKFARGPSTIIILLILGVACFIPKMYGDRHGYFVPIYTEQVSYTNYYLSLNETSPSQSVKLSDVYPDAVYGTSFRLYNFSVSTYPLSILVQGMSTGNFTLGHVENDRSWSFSLKVQENNSITMIFQRIHADMDITFTAERNYGMYITRASPIIPNLLVFLGSLLLLVAVVLAIQLDFPKVEFGIFKRRSGAAGS